MTSTTSTSSADPTSATDSARTPLLAALAVAVACLLAAVGTFTDPTGNSPEADHTVGDYLVVVGIVLVAAAVVFGLVVRTADRGNAARRAVVLGVLAVLSLAVFWAGLPPVLAIGAIACALAARDSDGRFSGGATAGLALGGLALVGAVVLAVFG